MNVLGDAFGAAIVAHLSRKELESGAREMEEMDRVDQMDSRMDVEKSKLMEIVKFDEEKEEEKTLLVTEDTKAEVVITDNRNSCSTPSILLTRFDQTNATHDFSHSH